MLVPACYGGHRGCCVGPLRGSPAQGSAMLQPPSSSSCSSSPLCAARKEQAHWKA